MWYPERESNPYDAFGPLDFKTRASTSFAIRARWRALWDSNPRKSFPFGGFQDRCLKPLGQTPTRKERDGARCGDRTHLLRLITLKHPSLYTRIKVVGLPGVEPGTYGLCVPAMAFATLFRFVVWTVSCLYDLPVQSLHVLSS